MKEKAKTKQQLILEMEDLRTKMDFTQRRLQEAKELLQAEITDRKRLEEIFAEAQKYSEGIVETIREPLIVLTPELRVITANHSFYETFHVTPEETEGEFVYSIGNRAWDIPSLRQLLEEIIPQNAHFNDFKVENEFPVIGRRIMLLNARRIYREGEGTERILMAIEDITEQMESEQALKNSETRYRRLFETAQDGILILEFETGRISDVNPFLIEMLDYTYEEFLGKHLWEIGPFRNIEAAKATFCELQDKEYVRYDDLPLERKDGSPIAVEFVSNVYLVNGHKVIQCNIRDITDRKLIAEALKEAHIELEQRVEKRTVELRTALSEIKTLKEQLEAENIYFRQENKMRHQFDHILGQSDGLKYVLYRAEQVAPTNTTVLILGETGTGKELIAAAIHNLSPRKDRR